MCGFWGVSGSAGKTGGGDPKPWEWVRLSDSPAPPSWRRQVLGGEAERGWAGTVFTREHEETRWE